MAELWKCMDGAQVDDLEETQQRAWSSSGNTWMVHRLMSSKRPCSGHGPAQETQIGLEVLSDLTDQALEGRIAVEEINALLEAADPMRRYGTGPVPMRLIESQL